MGREFGAIASRFPEISFAFCSRRELDITNSEDVKLFFGRRSWDYCINCAAYTAVDRAEKEEALAFAVNRDGASNIAKACLQNQIRLVHFSTDYVYHNTLNRPLLESDPLAPQSVYAKSKLAGEQAVLSILNDALILRTSWVYSSFGHNFVKTMLRLGKERAEIGVVADQIGAPTYARDIAAACLQIIQKVENDKKSWRGGVFNYSNEGVCSWYDFAQAIFDLSGLACSVRPIESKDYPTPAPRPFYSVLNKTKFKETFQIEIPYWRKSLERCLEKLEK